MSDVKIKPLEWRKVKDRNHWICDKTLSGKQAFIKVYAGTEVYNLYADGFRGCGCNYESLESAIKAAQDYHDNAVKAYIILRPKEV